MDLDETLLDNSAMELLKLISDKPGWKSYFDWVERGEAPAIPEALEFFRWARQEGFDIFFVSARKERFRECSTRSARASSAPIN